MKVENIAATLCHLGSCEKKKTTYLSYQRLVVTLFLLLQEQNRMVNINRSNALITTDQLYRIAIDLN